MSKYYIDCSRQNAINKSADKTNEWITQLNEGIRIPMGSEVRINNSQINYKGLNGQSIELSKDETLSFSFGFYISHSDFLVQAESFEDTAVETNPFYKNSGLNTIDYDCFVECNPQYQMSLAMNDALQQIKSQIFAGSFFGRTEQPLFACYINEYGYLTPFIDTVEIQIPANIYSINSLTDIINNELNGTRINVGGGVYKTMEQIKYENKNFDYSGIESPLLRKVNAWNNYYTFTPSGGGAPVTITDFSTLMLGPYATNDFMSINTLANRILIYVNYIDYEDIINDSKNLTRNDMYLWNNWRDTHYFASIQCTYLSTTKRAMSGQNYVYEPQQPTYTIDGNVYSIQNLDWNPLANGYYIGTSNFNFSFNADTNGFGFNFLHSPRTIPTHDRIGGICDKSGSIASFIKKDVTLYDKLKLTYNIDNQYINLIMNTIYQPRSRNSGVMIYNFDLNIARKYNTLNLDMNDPLLFNLYNYRQFNDFFNDTQEAKTAWEQSLLFQLGFTYDQLNNNEYYDLLYTYDLTPKRMYGLTTNNIIDVTTQSSISTLYCPLQSQNAQDPVNTTIPYIINSQVKYSDLQNTNKTKYALIFSVGTVDATYNYKNYKYVFYHECLTIPIITNSSSIIGNNLPILSKIGYFIITSDILTNDDYIKDSNMPILATVNKSNLSNQDFITSFNDIIHITKKDIVLNKIKIQILNSDLTSPNLGPFSSVMLEITPFYPQIEPKKK